MTPYRQGRSFGRRRAPVTRSHIAARAPLREIPMSNRQQSWPGHYPITLYALEAISKKWSDNPAAEIPRSERVLMSRAHSGPP